MKTFAVLLAAGSSTRFGQDKLWMPFRGRPLWTRSYDVLAACPVVDAVGIVCPVGRERDFRAYAPDAAFVLAGGSSRQDSSRIGTEAVPIEVQNVLVHDAARPLVTDALIRRIVDAVERTGAAFPAVPVVDTVKQRSGGGWTTPDRSTLVAVQTPQGARRDLLVRAHQEASGETTDEASLLESIGVTVESVEGEVRNIKVTNPEDASRMMSAMETRTGLGYDVHAFSTDPERPMWLGGVEFDSKPGLDGHSDADALLHAVTDALLGAVGLGDIGHLFPNTDPRWKDVRSSHFLAEAAAAVRAQGWDIVHVDATVLAERPKVAPRHAEVVAAIAEAAGVPIGRVSVKATTNEGLGAIGRGEGVAAFAVATVRKFDVY
ncbi:MAG: 2-C-methyl-D-erythritol 4-phosphate cytidylyltransferase [Armatimonadetes bacterium]|nr:2-C-methyl-D-erythritol 4-phosphate cytidylyltransferase [Armatimonadota bacterium]